MDVIILATFMCIALPAGLALIAWLEERSMHSRRRLGQGDYHWLAVGLILALEHPDEARRLLRVVEARSEEPPRYLELEADEVEADLARAAA